MYGEQYERWMAGRRKLVTTVASRLTENHNGLLLDVAAGDGEFSTIVAKHTNSRLVTHDMSGDACRDAARSGNRTVRGDVRRLPFADGAADITVAFEVIEHLFPRDEYVAVDELHRITKPGGTLLISTPNRFSLESVKGTARYFFDGTVWNARDETHIRILSRRGLLAMLKPKFDVKQCYGYYLIPEFLRRPVPGSTLVTTNPLLWRFCFVLLIVATAKPIVGDGSGGKTLETASIATPARAVEERAPAGIARFHRGDAHSA